MWYDTERSPHDRKEGLWRGEHERSLCRARSQMGVRASSAGGRGATRQRRALRRCHSDGYTAGWQCCANVVAVEASWDRVLWDSVGHLGCRCGGARQHHGTGLVQILQRYGGTHYAFESCRIEDEWVIPLLIVLESSSTIPVGCGRLG